MTENGKRDGEASIVDSVAAYWRTAILRSAFELHIPDHVMAGLTTPAAIAAQEGAAVRSLTVLMDSLCALGLLDKSDGVYRLRPHLAALLPSFSQMAPYCMNAENWTMWGRVTEAVRTGAPVGAGDEYWVDYAHGTRAVTRLQGAEVATIAAMESGRGVRVVDVGCGSGGIGYGFALADPSARVTGLDAAGVIERAAEHASELGLSQRVTLRATNVVTAETLGDEQFDLAIVANIAHLLDPATNRALLRKVFAALAPAGRVMIIDILPDDERRTTAYPLMFAVEMLLRTPGGSTYTFAEFSDWLRQAGFEEIECRPMRGHESAVMGLKPASAA